MRNSLLVRALCALLLIEVGYADAPKASKQDVDRLVSKTQAQLKAAQSIELRLKLVRDLQRDLRRKRKTLFPAPIRDTQLKAYEDWSLLINSLDSWVNQDGEVLDCRRVHQSAAHAWRPDGRYDQPMPHRIAQSFELLADVCRDPALARPPQPSQDL
jgi:hypothetical protein